jgi:hypothetical protein
MFVECLYPSGERLKLEINKDNYLLPIPSLIEIKETNGENVYIDGIISGQLSIPYTGENKIIECGSERCKALALNDLTPENFKVEYHEFAKTLRDIYVINAIDEEMLFIAFNENQEDDGINLCTFNRQIESVEEDRKLEEIRRHIKHLVDVFHRPKLHLKSNNEIRPVESVSRIGHEAIKHLASHSEHWEARKASGLIPRRLLAKTLEDNYKIYENIAAKCLVDKLYSYAINKRDTLKNISMQMPSEDSFMSVSDEQKSYFKAREILLKGYSNDDIQYINSMLEDQIEQANYIIGKLSECKETLLYRELKHSKKMVGPLKPTNIFMMDKNYKYVYKLWYTISDEFYEESIIRDKEITDEYELYCQTLLIFSTPAF